MFWLGLLIGVFIGWIVKSAEEDYENDRKNGG